METVTWALMTQYAEDNDLDSTWLYGDTFCETVFGVLGSYEWEKKILADCKSNFQPDANDKIDEAYDDFWSGEYGTGA